ncbi:V-set domain-containing T-cell activation inhibitor 1-like isoform X2 [Silurus meridionalis]|uniref:V-set domain-containing T-cell activation inhibitor 1-like isoform X2 n=1 Tax=Silurus meridionalis TaxID=175797 RepID=UPI001EECB779|nr:V-set domain-containing T-cell activation inhibitor 1-like isoform X2 [Silurus meridionalis]
MERSCYYLCVCYGFFMFLLNKESITVEVVQGDSVILPCSAGGNEKDIFWRHNNTKTVYDIIESKEDFDDQDAAFRGRVEGFPSKFTEGNYSIRLKNVIHSDAGNYSCHIPNTKTVHVELRLRVYPKRSQHPDMQQNGGVDIQPVNLLCFSAALLGLSVLLF